MDLVRLGRVYDLGLELNSSVPQGPSDAFAPFSFQWTKLPDPDRDDGAFQFAAESVCGTPHIGTHIDGLMHVTSGTMVFGGCEFAEVFSDNGLTRDGIETVLPIITRAVILDLAGLRGRPLPDGYEITVSDLRDACAAQHVAVRRGDAVLVRTAKVRQYGVDNDAYQHSQPGVGRDASVWLFDQGMAVLGTDTTSTEPVPFLDPMHTTHQAMLVERGVHLVENLDLDAVTHDRVVEALFVCLPLRITGATGSWVRPVAVT
jgi:kynurenine formamidase